MYTLIYSRLFQKQIKKQEQKVRSRIIQTLERVRIRPHSHVKRLVGSHLYRLRVGDIRILLDIEEEKIHILVLRMDKRERFYR